MIETLLIFAGILVIGLYFYLDPETCWSNIRTPIDFIKLFVQRTKQHFCFHDWKVSKTCIYCTKCFHTKELR